MPSVVAKDITLTTVNAPTIDTLLPADDAVNVLGTNELVITFSEAVTTSTGTIKIYRSRDDVLIESVLVTSAQVTGSGTDTITVTPNATLVDETEFYIQIASTTFENADNVFFFGIEDTSAWSFTTGDYTGPVFSAIKAVPTRESTVLTWNTDEIASSQVVYGITDITTLETNTAPRVTTHSVTLSDLERCTEYSYRVLGVDASINSNSATSSVQSFTTSGCSSGSSATRVTHLKKYEQHQDPTSIPTEHRKTLQEIWNEQGLAGTVARLLIEPNLAITEPQIAIERYPKSKTPFLS